MMGLSKIGISRDENGEPPEQRTFGGRAAEPEDEPQPVAQAGDGAAGAVEVGGAAVHPEVAAQLGGGVGQVAHADELVHPARGRDDGAAVREALVGGAPVVRARARLADAAEGERGDRAVHVRVVDGGAAGGDAVEDLGGVS